jgi:hypothetical protein
MEYLILHPTCGEVDIGGHVQPPLHVPAQHAQPVGVVLLQVVDRDTAVGRKEVRDIFGLVWAGGVHWAIGQVAANQPRDRELCSGIALSVNIDKQAGAELCQAQDQLS